MTLEEAMLEMGDAQDYLVYRDAKTDRVSRADAPRRRASRSDRKLVANDKPAQRIAQTRNRPNWSSSPA